MRKIDILIPTYNRVNDLLVNLAHLKNEIEKSHLIKEVRIIVSDNHSTDNTEKEVHNFITKNGDIDLVYHRNAANIGLEANVVSTIQLATSPFVMFCGDDDLIAKGYLFFCINRIETCKVLGCIIPGLKSVDKKGSFVIGRIETYEEKILEPGFQSMFCYSHLAHQMSGLLIKNNDVFKTYLEKPEFRNPYLFIFFTAHQLFNHLSIYAPRYKTIVQIENEKDWGYNEIGLLDEVFKSYYFFKGHLLDSKIADLLIQFVRMHSYRINIEWSKPLKVVRSWFGIKSQASAINGFSRKLGVLLAKEYILSWKNVFNK